MDRIWIAILLGLTISIPLSASDVVKEEPFPYWITTYAGQGNSSIAYADGFGSLLTNPAGFAREKEELSILRLSSTFYGGPPSRIPLLRTLLTSSLREQDEPILSKELTGQGLGMGGLWGIGYVGRGLGLGFLGGFDVVGAGNSYPLGLKGEILTQFMLVIGYSIQKSIGPLNVYLGGDIRPLIRIHALLDQNHTAYLLKHYFGTDVSPLTGSFYADTSGLNGSGIGFDLGGLLRWGPFSFGITLRDVFDTQLFYSWNNLGSIRDALSKGGLPPVQTVPGNNVYIIPMSVFLGAAYEFKLGASSSAFTGRLHGEWLNPSRFVNDPSWETAKGSFRAGIEGTFFSFLSLRAGYYEGKPTYGGGVKFAIFEMNVAFFTRSVTLADSTTNAPSLNLEFAVRW